MTITPVQYTDLSDKKLVDLTSITWSFNSRNIAIL